MRLLFKLILVFGFLLLQTFCFGHNPLSARYYLESNNKVSLLTINLSQDGVNSALYKIHGKEKLSVLSRAELEKLIVDYIKSNFNLEIDGKEIVLNEGGIKFGSHQTDLKFVLPPISPAFDKMEIGISAFKENVDHQTIFTYDIQGLKDRAILKSKNNYKASFVKGQKKAAGESMSFSIFGIFILITGLISFVFYRYKSISTSDGSLHQ